MRLHAGSAILAAALIARAAAFTAACGDSREATPKPGAAKTATPEPGTAGPAATGARFPESRACLGATTWAS